MTGGTEDPEVELKTAYSRLQALTPVEQRAVARILDAWLAMPSREEPLDAVSLARANMQFDPSRLASEVDSTPTNDVLRLLRDWDVASGRIVPIDEQGSPPAVTIWEALSRRQSTRSFSDSGIRKAVLNQLLNASLGITGWSAAYGFRDLPRRSYPSAGGLQSVSVYLFLRDTPGLHEGLYRFVPALGLEYLSGYDVRWKISQVCPSLDWPTSAPCVFALVGQLDKLEWKYGQAAYRLLHLDAGVLLENLYLVSTSLGLSGCALVDYDDEALISSLPVGPSRICTLALFACGHTPRS